MGTILVVLVGSMLLKEYVTTDILDSMYLFDVVDAADEEYDFVPQRYLAEDINTDCYKDQSRPVVADMAWTETKYKCLSIKKSSNGFVEEYYDVQQCYSSMILVPGTSLMSNGFLGVMYLLFLSYLFLGISIIADIFMEAIEVITSKTSQITIFDKTGKIKIGIVEVPVWNPTIANLTLMALGSSAPEILLSVIGALSNLGEK
jgi:hypothetical protein